MGSVKKPAPTVSEDKRKDVADDDRCLRDTLVAFLQMAPTHEVLDIVRRGTGADRRDEDGVVDEDATQIVNGGSDRSGGGGGGALTTSSPSKARGIMGDSAQRTILRCFTHPIARSFPPGSAYRQRLLKAATLAAEDDECEINDELADIHTELLLAGMMATKMKADKAAGAVGGVGGGSDDSWCYKTYVYRSEPRDLSVDSVAATAGVNNGECAEARSAVKPKVEMVDEEQEEEEQEDPLRGAGTVTIHTSLNLFEGGTGCHEWSAGFYLAELAMAQPRLFAGRAVVELGAGVVGSAFHLRFVFASLFIVFPSIITYMVNTCYIHHACPGEKTKRKESDDAFFPGAL